MTSSSRHVIVREFTGGDGSIRLVAKCYPPSPTIWLWLMFSYHQERTEFDCIDTNHVRRWVASGAASLMSMIGRAALQDFRADLLRVLGDIDREFAKAVRG